MNSIQLSYSNLKKKKVIKYFSLIELLVVVAIIAILSSMLQPALKGAMSASRLMVCTNNHKQIGLAIAYYVNDFNQFLPSSVPNLTTQPANFGSYPTFRLRHDDGQGVGLGLLFETGQLEDKSLSLLFCPTWVKQESSQLNSHTWFNTLYTEVMDEKKGFSEITSNNRGVPMAFTSTENDTYFPGSTYTGKITMKISDLYYQTRPILLMDYMRDFNDLNTGYGGGETHGFEKNNFSAVDGSVKTVDILNIYSTVNDWSNTRNYQHDFTVWDKTGEL